MRLEKEYKSFLQSIGKLDSSGDRIVKLGSQPPVVAERKTIDTFLSKLASVSLKARFYQQVVIIMIIIMILASFIILMVDWTVKERFVMAGGVAGFISILINFLSNRVSELTETEISMNCLRYLPEEEAIRCIELFYEIHRNRRSSESVWARFSSRSASRSKANPSSKAPRSAG